jgi:hypothetical protein
VKLNEAKEFCCTSQYFAFANILLISFNFGMKAAARSRWCECLLMGRSTTSLERVLFGMLVVEVLLHVAVLLYANVLLNSFIPAPARLRWREYIRKKRSSFEMTLFVTLVVEVKVR